MILTEKNEWNPPRLDRRRFLQIAAAGMAAASGSWLAAIPAWAHSALDAGIKAQELISAGSFAKAAQVLDEALLNNPDDDWLWGMLGRAQLGAGQPGKAVTAFRRAVRINPSDTYSRMMVERITQQPFDRPEVKERPETPLEREARLEEERMQKNLEAGTSDVYRVRRVVIDPGHGGFDPGAVGPSGLKEKDVVLDIGLRLHQILSETGRYTAHLTRKADHYIPLGARTATANQYRADLLISLHINANEKREAHGSETYFCSEKASSEQARRVAELENAVIRFDDPVKKEPGYHVDVEGILFHFERSLYWRESGRFANLFQKRLDTDLPFRSRGIHSANFFVLRTARMPAILLETGFISNPENEQQLKNPAVREKIARVVAGGLA